MKQCIGNKVNLFGEVADMWRPTVEGKQIAFSARVAVAFRILSTSISHCHGAHLIENTHHQFQSRVLIILRLFLLRSVLRTRLVSLQTGVPLYLPSDQGLSGDSSV